MLATVERPGAAPVLWLPHQVDHHQGLLTQLIRYAHAPGEQDSQEVVKYCNVADTKLNAC